MISTSKLIKSLENVLNEMEKLNARKVRSISLSRTSRNSPKIPKAAIKAMLEKLKESEKTKLSIHDIQNDDSRFIYRDMTEGKLIVNILDKEVITGVRIWEG